ncbi:hypothetical protein JCM33374_g6324 [Metschnikowia sp. JCM 33374]|nr:hypothetical protein JCM33374_g6324 [Metschnikowia sp. JCM 33374]
MSEFKSYKKADLAKVASKVGIKVLSKDTKQSLLAKIEQFLEESPERAKDLIDNDDDLEVVTLVDENDATEDEEDDEQEDDEQEDDEQEDDVDEADDNEDDEENGEDELEDDDEDDKDYNAPPPINLKEWIVDPTIAVIEAAHDKVLQVTDAIGVTTLECNAELRESLSKTVTLNYLEAAAEVSHFLYHYVPLVPIKDNQSVHQVFRDNIPQLNSWSWSVPDITALYSFSVISIFSNWVIYAVALPLLISYYINFTRRVVVLESSEHIEDDNEDISEDFSESVQVVIRAYKYDPFIFALSKVLIYYFIHKNGALVALDSVPGVLHAFKNLLFIQLGVYHTFLTNLGSFPLIAGLANVVIGLYSQFEDY